MVASSPNDSRSKGPVDPDASSRAGLREEVPVNPMASAPLMAHSAAMVAAATAVGFGMMHQFAGLMFGAMQAAVETSQKVAEALEQERVSLDEGSFAETQKPAPSLRIVVDNGPLAPVLAGADEAAVVAQVPSLPKPVKATKPKVSKRAPDDFKRISGIGPKLEKILHDKGLKRFADVARMSAEAADALDLELGLGGRVKRDQWIAQAKALAKETV